VTGRVSGCKVYGSQDITSFDGARVRAPFPLRLQDVAGTSAASRARKLTSPRSRTFSLPARLVPLIEPRFRISATVKGSHIASSMPSVSERVQDRLKKGAGFDAAEAGADARACSTACSAAAFYRPSVGPPPWEVEE
jgi:hypothetical protein